MIRTLIIASLIFILTACEPDYIYWKSVCVKYEEREENYTRFIAGKVPVPDTRIVKVCVKEKLFCQYPNGYVGKVKCLT